jgi:hypothetical protein
VGVSVGESSSALNNSWIRLVVTLGSSPRCSWTAFATCRARSAKAMPQLPASSQVVGRRLQTSPPFATQARMISCEAESSRTSRGTISSGGLLPNRNRMLCRLTDLELSGAPRLATREADQTRPTRPLERLVSLHAHGDEEASTTSPERRREPKSRAPASQECCRSHRR